MTTNEFTTEVLRRLERVPPDRYQTFLARIDLEIGRPRGTPGNELLRFAGSISEETANSMLKIIEEECEQIDYESWGLPAGYEHRDRPSS